MYTSNFYLLANNRINLFEPIQIKLIYPKHKITLVFFFSKEPNEWEWQGNLKELTCI